MEHLGLLAVAGDSRHERSGRSEPLIPQHAQPYSADLLRLGAACRHGQFRARSLRHQLCQGCREPSAIV